jgi:hypothetical protein
MTTYKTLAEARSADQPGVEIAEIIHATEGRCFVRVKIAVVVVKANLAKIPEIAKVIAAHGLTTPEQDEATRRTILATTCICERCAAKVDGNTAFKQTKITRFQSRPVRVNAYYCEPCRQLLANLSH